MFINDHAGASCFGYPSETTQAVGNTKIRCCQPSQPDTGFSAHPRARRLRLSLSLTLSLSRSFSRSLYGCRDDTAPRGLLHERVPPLMVNRNEMHWMGFASKNSIRGRNAATTNHREPGSSVLYWFQQNIHTKVQSTINIDSSVNRLGGIGFVCRDRYRFFYVFSAFFLRFFCGGRP